MSEIELHDQAFETASNPNSQRAIKLKSVDVKVDTYIDYGVEHNNKDPKFKVVDHMRISKHKNIFAKGYVPNSSKEVFVIKIVKNTLSFAYVISNLNGQKTVGQFYEKEL